VRAFCEIVAPEIAVGVEGVAGAELLLLRPVVLCAPDEDVVQLVVGGGEQLTDPQR
jgi:hypothetical protein